MFADRVNVDCEREGRVKDDFKNFDLNNIKNEVIYLNKEDTEFGI